MNNLGGRRSRPLENVEISASERSALLPVVSMHCLVLYCYLLASTKRGNESEALREGNWPAVRQGSHNNIAPFRPTSTDCAAGRRGRGRGHTQTRRRCGAVAVVSSPPLSSSPPPTHSAVWTNGRWRQISQEQNGCNAMAPKSRVEGAAAP